MGNHLITNQSDVSLHMLADYLAKYDVEFSVLIRGLSVASKHQGPAGMITDSLSDDPVPAMEARLRELPDLVRVAIFLFRNEH
jgi:hypothetical protein